MEIQEYITKIKTLDIERKPNRAISLCKMIREIAAREGVSIIHINNVYKQLLDNGMVNKDELLKFQMDVSEQWGKSVGLNSSIIINREDDIEVQEF